LLAINLSHRSSIITFNTANRRKGTVSSDINTRERDFLINGTCQLPKLAKSSPASNMMNTSDPSFRMLLLGLMVVQNSFVVLFGRYTRADKTTEELYVVNDLILICEALKFILACALEHNTTNGKLMKSVKENIIDVPLDALKILIPSMLYLIQNSLLYVALSNLSAPLFQVTYQSKLLTTALVSVVMLQRSYKFKQWVCLCLLGLGVAIVVLGEKKEPKDDENADKDDGNAEQSITVGLISVTIACFSSALAGVYFEKVLKKPTMITTEGGQEKTKNPVSLWMRNIQMAFFSVIIALINGQLVKGPDADKPFMHGFTVYVWIVVVLQAGGGLLVAAVIKYADNVLKGLATGVSVVTATICSMFFFSTPLTGQFAFGSAIILGSVYFFTNDLPCQNHESKIEHKASGDDVELNQPLVTSASKS